jgi:endonuclease/exonuclease/phosphatase family metal-dependent hydrolase
MHARARFAIEVVVSVVAVLFGPAAWAQVESVPADPLSPASVAASVDVRFATFNVEDIRRTDLEDQSQPRLRRIASIIRDMRPNVILLNEIAYDGPGSPGFKEGDTSGQNAARFVATFLDGVSGDAIRYRAYMAPVNTGMFSGFDLDNDGRVVATFPTPEPSRADGAAPRQTADQRAYGNDCWGFGTFPGQYGMALLVDERLEILTDRVRTFRLIPWDYVPGAFVPRVPETNEPWYAKEEWAAFRLSSKSHWDVPIRLPNGAVIHALCSHPTPPAFDGPEMRNQKRNHDEIRFWADYLDNAAYVVDDASAPGGLDHDAHFVILGDLNADPVDGGSFKNPIQRNLLANPRVNSATTPVSDLAIEGLDPSDTSMFKLRVDYVLPSASMQALGSGVWRSNPEPRDKPFPSDHFPVWVDVRVPAPGIPPGPSDAR